MSVETMPLTRRQLRERERAQEAAARAAAPVSIVLPPVPEEDEPLPVAAFVLPPIPEVDEQEVVEQPAVQVVPEEVLPAPVAASSAVIPGRRDLDEIRAWTRRMSVNRHVLRVVPDDYFTKKSHSMADFYGPFPALAPDLVDFRLPWVLSATLGVFGVDRFYLGRHKTGLLKLLTLGGLGFWWAADMFRLATGHAVDRAGHPFDGTRGQRVLAIAASVILTVCAAWVVIPSTGTTALAAATAISGARQAVQEVTTPEEPPSWTPVGQFTGDPKSNPSQTVTVTGTAVRISYSLTDAGILYLVPVGSDIVAQGSTPVVTTDAKGQGVAEILVEPGNYQFVLQSQGAYWMARVEELRAP